MAKFRRVRSNSGGGTAPKRHKGTFHNRHNQHVDYGNDYRSVCVCQFSVNWILKWYILLHIKHVLTQLITNILCALLQVYLV